MPTLSKLEQRYLRNTLTVWMVLVFLYAGFWWAVPFSYGTLVIVFLVCSFVYGLWFLRG